MGPGKGGSGSTEVAEGAEEGEGEAEGEEEGGG